ncbi:MAG: 7-cyano-7-deazaguanine synthase [Candidatus Melainabacteria bacterium]|nr:7-cyano-7-deazaguanine synthase [Candidatus Melainabacteria bacterium]
MSANERKLNLCVLDRDQRNQDGWSEYATIGDQIVFDTEVLDALAVGGCQPIHYDLLVLSAAVEFADRKWKRPLSWSRDLYLTVPVIEIKTWQAPRVRDSLEQVLKYLTGDTWRFDFVRASNLRPCEFRQLKLYFNDHKTFAIAYSDGLDSRAVSALSGSRDEALCIRVANTLHHAQDGDSFFTQIPFRVKNVIARESSFRSRSFQFAAITVIAAHIRKLKRVIVPESGQGALGPAILPLHGIYADYRNYPAFFRKMEVFARELLGYEVQFEQPRLWFTKGQTVLDFLKLPKKHPDHLTNTRSCWQTRHVVNVGGRRLQCGLCAACLLRRISLHTAAVFETPGTYVINDLSASDIYQAMTAIPNHNDRTRMIEYGSVGARHFQQLADMASFSDDDLFVYVLEIAEATRASVQDTLKNLRTLLSNHGQEWHSFLSAQGGKSFLHSWVEEAHDDRPE